jgi:hypothetical protein
LAHLNRTVEYSFFLSESQEIIATQWPFHAVLQDIYKNWSLEKQKAEDWLQKDRPYSRLQNHLKSANKGNRHITLTIENIALSMPSANLNRMKTLEIFFDYI